MKIIRTCKILVGQKRSYSLRLEERYVRLVLWFFNVQDQQPFLTLMERIVRLNRDSGYKYSVPYLKECLRLIQHWKSGNPTIALKGDIRVASKRGLPLILPSSLRIQLERSEPQVLRIVLTLISIFRIYKYPSSPTLSTITGPFTGISSTLDWGEIRRIRTLFNPFIPSTVPKGREELIPLKTAGPNFKRSILGAPLDAYAWRLASEELRSSFKVLSDYFGSSLAEKLEEESSIVHSLPLKWKESDADKVGVRLPILGKLSLKNEPAGKVRVFAIVDVWTQSILEPLHEYIYSILRKIPQDGTFDQSRPLSILRAKLDDTSLTYSFDLSAATDRLPIAMQVQILATFLPNGWEVANAWATLLVGRSYHLRSVGELRYAVGQPMGALSSFGMLALSHHFIVQLAAFRVGFKGWFEMYALLGDDIVIADKAVAESYRYLMSEYLGVSINMSKTLVSSHGIMEFAKRLVSPSEEFTPLGPKNIVGVLSNPGDLPSLFLDYFGKGGPKTNWTEVKLEEAIERLSPSLLKLSKGGKEALTWSISGPFGFLNSYGLGPFKASSSRGTIDMVRMRDPKILIAAIEDALLKKLSREWDSAFDKTLESALGVWRVKSHPNLVRDDGLPVSPHTFPSYRALAIRAIDAIDEVIDQRTPASLELEHYIRDEQVFNDAKGIRHIINLFHSTVPRSNPWIKPKVVRLKISRLGIDFANDVLNHIMNNKELLYYNNFWLKPNWWESAR